MLNRLSTDYRRNFMEKTLAQMKNKSYICVLIYQKRMKLRPFHAIIVLSVLIICSVWASISSYNHTRQDIVNDMNQALALTLSEKQEGWITPDTIQNYRSHLKIDDLKECSFVYYAMDSRDKGLCSKKMKLKRSTKPLEFQSYANCSIASVFAMSDQRTSGLLSLMSILWAIASFVYFRKHKEDMTIIGHLMMSHDDQSFYDINRQPVKFTPMQEQLMRMFFTSNNHQLSKQEICDTLWPKKPDASETLYTLIRRIKPIAEEKGNLEIITERGKDYQMRVKQ